MNDTLSACDPNFNAVVQASAGTGKTWLLVSRIIRILLNNQNQDNILAITFTRKAASEMQSRLLSRLFDLATCSQSELDQSLIQIGLNSTTILRNNAQKLYEQLLRNPYPLRTTTFHSFCQDLLRRFPLEADVPPGFELLENSNLLQNLAKEELFSIATRFPNGQLAHNIQTLFERCGGLDNTLKAMSQFLNHRIDWWAYTHNQENAVAYATERLLVQLHLSNTLDPLPKFFIDVSQFVKNCAGILNTATTKTAKMWAILLEKGLNCEYESAFRFSCITNVFYTKDKQTRFPKSIPKTLSEKNQQKLADLSEMIVAMISHTTNIVQTQNTFFLSQAWYQVGHALVNLYQKLKEEQRILDFSDLEWKAYRLLSDPENKYWIQYKLDQRIDHILVDEFQDTNPTQWRLLQPILEEIAAGDPDQKRSVFLVGDTKQSIYRFRRADPLLFKTASTWMANNMQAKSVPQNSSRRSAKIIMDVVNHVFTNNNHFPPHSTFLNSMYGKFVLLPLIQPDTKIDNEEMEFRNPLLKPRNSPHDTRHYREGLMISDEIGTLIAKKTIIIENENPVYLNYRHIIILLKNRTHIADYEKSLRDKNIPFIGTRRGSLLLNLEVNDIVALLKFLITPFSNVDLATVLRSPLFSCSDEDLMLLAEVNNGLWIDRLRIVSRKQPVQSPLCRAYYLLISWQQLTGKLPVHDLLDKIYFDGNVISRYESAVPRSLRNQTRANLIRFLELALEIDSGRYPSLASFLDRLSLLKRTPEDAPNEESSSDDQNRVRILTIHGAKGLEAPVVFIADSAQNQQARFAYEPLVKWPTHSLAPSHFQILAKKSDLDHFSSKLLDRHIQDENSEDLNLLYVALTRARQFMFVSGCQPNRGPKSGWYDMVKTNLDKTYTGFEDGRIEVESGSPEISPVIQSIESNAGPIEINALLTIPLEIAEHAQAKIASPSKIQSSKMQQELSYESLDNMGREGQLRGKLIHRMFELICEKGAQHDIIPDSIINEFSIRENSAFVFDCWNEVLTVYHDTNNADIFRCAKDSKSYNEVPIHYSSDKHAILGIIDRLIVNTTTATIVDYKTHQNVTRTNYHVYVEQYTPQMQSYISGVKQIWPNRNLRAYLLFTHCNLKYAFQN